jgi:hypothetical protein
MKKDEISNILVDHSTTKTVGGKEVVAGVASPHCKPAQFHIKRLHIFKAKECVGSRAVPHGTALHKAMDPVGNVFRKAVGQDPGGSLLNIAKVGDLVQVRVGNAGNIRWIAGKKHGWTVTIPKRQHQIGAKPEASWSRR